MEIIAPLEVRPPVRGRNLFRFWRSNVIIGLFFLIALAVMATGGFIFIRYLSHHPPRLNEYTNPVSQSEPDTYGKKVPDNHRTINPQADTMTKPDQGLQEKQPPAEARKTVEPGGPVAEKEKAEKELGKYLKLKDRLEKKGVAEWGGKQYNEMINFGREADMLFMDNAYLAASKKYVHAGKKAAELANETRSVFQKLIKEGLKAFEDGNSNRTQEKLHAALMIEPSNMRIQRYLERAEKLDGVNRLLASGQNHEKNNRFAFAHADYQEALKLDPESRKAQKALSRIKKRIANEQFQKLMSEGLTAYHNGNYGPAGIQLLKAKSFRPDSYEVKEALKQVDAAIRLKKIEKLRREAMAAEEAEDWTQALKFYLAVLQIDPNINFAVQGKKRALKQIRVAKRMRFFLQKPDVMASDRQLQNAILTIEEAERLKPRGPRLNAGLDKLKSWVNAARTPVPVRIESDNFTEIAVYKIGKLGRFAVHELLLRPGVYTVVGSRNGYRDVRKKIIVKSGQKLLRITVMCKDKVEP